MPRARTKYTDEKRQEIADYLEEGHSQTSAKKKFETSGTIVAAIAKEFNIKPKQEDADKTETARKARQYYTKENRIKAWDSVFEKCMIRFKDDDLTPFEFQKMVLALAAATDKLRQEESGNDTAKGEIGALLERMKTESS